MNKIEPKYYPIELFHWAGMTDSNLFELIDVLTAHPEYLNEKNSTEDNCLLIAARAGNVGMVKYLIEQTDIDVHYRHPKDGNVLLAAAAACKREVFHYLLTIKDLNLHSRNNRGYTSYHYLAQHGADDMFEKLLEVDVEKKSNILDGAGRHCLYNFIDNYAAHKNYWCFELIQESLTVEDLMHKDRNGINIFEYLENKNKFLIREKGDYCLEPLIPILESRGPWNQLDFELKNNQNVENKKINKV